LTPPRDIGFWLGGNICRCGAYLGIVAVVVEQNELIHRTLPARWPPHLQNIIAAGGPALHHQRHDLDRFCA
jgi:hypothetical protein